MAIEFGEIGLDEELGSFKASIDSIDMDSVKKRSAKSFAEEMAEQVRLAVVAEDDITSPAMNSKYERGPGPSMASPAAWKVTPTGSDSYRVTPHPAVETRATVLNYGYQGKIYPKNADALRFTINGVPVYAGAVEGPDRTHYWKAAFNNMQASGEIERIAERELRSEIEGNF